ncbi:hypothetical protein [Actinoplanes italicus]|uniref:hypothetical protein n=1 Tax=Actinoplanes italicus TaxID=113567 RepID=UPI000D0726B4|nr:hypothetical protein [Actinoplanes italicus]
MSARPAPEAWIRLVTARLATDGRRRMRGWWAALRRSGPPEPARPPRRPRPRCRRHRRVRLAGPVHGAAVIGAFASPAPSTVPPSSAPPSPASASLRLTGRRS